MNSMLFDRQPHAGLAGFFVFFRRLRKMLQTSKKKW